MNILYIGGAGRSGSTLLDMILGNLPDFFSVGELRYFWEYTAQDEISCGCGKDLSKCDFWSKVKEELAPELCKSMDIISRRWNHTRNLPRILLNTPEEWRTLAKGTNLLYQATWQAAKAQVLVDTSKVPAQLVLLKQIPSVNLRVLQLVRDGRAVSYSWNKRRKRESALMGQTAYMPQRSMTSAVSAWATENAMMLRLSRDIPHVFMRYEDFIQNPRTVLENALQELGFNNNLSFLDNPTLLLPSTHSMGGNPIRFNNEFTIESDDEWRDKMPLTTKLSLGLLAFPLMKRFGYKL